VRTPAPRPKKPRPRKVAARAAVRADLSLQSSGSSAIAAAQVALLEAIAATGSITAAARRAGISYKTAWDRVDAINNAAAQPLVQRSAGGSGGGGTVLTAFGQRIVDGFRAMEKEHAAFLERLGSEVASLDDVAGFLRVGTVRTSARNQYRGVVSQVTPGAVNAEIAIEIGAAIHLSVIVTEESRKRMALRPGVVVTALVKATDVLLSPSLDIAVSARNRLQGRIARITRGAVNSDVVVDLGEGKSISAMVTNPSVDDLGLGAGDPVCAFFKASSVILLAG
jgi:molybdate transport system regulatory protein